MNPVGGRLNGFGDWSQGHTPAANTQATTSKAAGGTGVRHVCTSISITLLGGTSAPTAAFTEVYLRDGATGAGTILWEQTLGVPATAGATTTVNLAPLNIIGSSNTAMTLEFSGASGANTVQSVAMSGYDILGGG